MVFCCWVIGCSNRSNREKDKSFFRFPAVITRQGDETEEVSRKRRAKWRSNISRADVDPTKHSRVCSDHFISGKPSPLYDENSPDWAPTLKLGHNKIKVNTDLAVSRYDRLDRRKQKRRSHGAAKAMVSFTSISLPEESTFKPSALYDYDNPNLTPTLNLGHNKLGIPWREILRHKQLMHQRQVKMENMTAETLLSFTSPSPGTIQSMDSDIERDEQDGVERDVEQDEIKQEQSFLYTCMPVADGVSCQTDLTAEDISKMEGVINSLTKKSTGMQIYQEHMYSRWEKITDSKFTEEAFEKNDMKISSDSDYIGADITLPSCSGTQGSDLQGIGHEEPVASAARSEICSGEITRESDDACDNSWKVYKEGKPIGHILDDSDSYQSESRTNTTSESSFALEQSLKQKPFICAVCKFRFKRQCHLQSHFRCHRGDKRFKCPVYRYADSSYWWMKRHMRTHTGKKPLKCSVCGYNSARHGNLIKHIRTHTGEKHFKCSVCDYSCSHRSNLNRHITRHHSREKKV